MEEKKYVVKRGHVMSRQEELKSIFPFIVTPPDIRTDPERFLSPESLPKPAPAYPRGIEPPPAKLPLDFVGPSAYYEIVPSGKENMCEHCAAMAGQVFFGGDYDEGTTAPPFHPNCGCTTREWREWLEGETDEDSSELLPLDGMTLSSDGARLLAEMEVPMSRSVIQRDEDGNITAIRNHDIGDGGITVGFGTYVPYGSAGDAKRRELMDKYGIDATSTDIWIPIDVALRLYADEQTAYAERAIAAIERQGISEVTQQQFDAILMQVFNSNYSAMVAAYFDDSKTDEEVVQEILDVYRTFDDWDKYAAGWENRVRAQVRVFRHGEYLKDW
jgi:hypothetical protein